MVRSLGTNFSNKNMEKGDDLIYLGETNFRNQLKRFGIWTEDRRRHMFILGRTGGGKSSLMLNSAVQDVRAGHGLGFVDPHGDAAEALLDFVPKHRVNDVVYFNAADADFSVAFNVMERVEPDCRHLVVSGLMSVFKRLWPNSWSNRLEHILTACLMAVLEYPNSTLLGLNRMLSDPEYRRKVVNKITDPVVKSYWIHEFARYTHTYEAEALAGVANKIGQLVSAPLLRCVLGQVKTSINMRKVMDEGKILIVNLSKGKIGEDSSLLLGGLVLTKLELAALARADLEESKRRDFFVYVDEAHSLVSEKFHTTLSESRKYRLSWTLADQYLGQLDKELVWSIIGNCGNLIAFRCGPIDAELLEKEFGPEFSARDLVNLGKYEVYAKLMVNGVATRPFSARTLAPFPRPTESNREQIIKVSRQRYATPRRIVEDKIARWSGFGEPAKNPKADR